MPFLVFTASGLHCKIRVQKQKDRQDQKQCFGSGLDPDSIRSVDPDPGGQKVPHAVSGLHCKIRVQKQKDRQDQKQCVGSGLDPDSIRSVDPDPGGQK